MADKRIYQLDAASTLSAGDKLAIDKSSLSEAMSIDASLILQPIADVAGDVSTLSGEVSTLSGTVSTLSGTVSNLSSAVSNKAAKSDLTSISTTGSTNNSGSTITSGTFFYKSGSLARALTDIASGATLTLNTNYELVTAGGLNELNSALNSRLYGYRFVVKSKAFTSNSSGRIVFSNDDIPIEAKGVTANAIGANTSTLIGTCTVPWLYTIDIQWRTMLVNTSGNPAMQPVPNTSLTIVFTYWILAN